MTGCTEEWVWHLAKSYVNVNNYCWHKGIRHALAQHPCRDDGAMLRHRQFATNQQVSVMHPVPVHKLLQCCCRTTTRP